MSARTLLAVTLTIAGVIPVVDGSLAASPPQDPEVYRGETTAVVVDVVVRDRRGRPIVDLQKGDFELLEDGVRQEIGAVTLVASGGDARASGRTAPSVPSGGQEAYAPAPDAPTFLAMVFDRMSLEARAQAYKGALAYLDAPGGPDDFAGVFVVELSLRTVQPFTNDPGAVRAALLRAASSAGSLTSGPPDHRLGSAPTASAESDPDDFFANAGGGAANALAEDLVARAEQSWRLLEGERRGYETTNALLALTAALGTLPGRKTIVFFSDGLSLPEAVMPRFQRVIEAANAANVGIYTIDAAGLRVHSELQATAREVRGLGNAGLTLNEDGSSQSDLRTLERNELALRRDPHVGLTVLARETGGFLIDQTNDLAGGFRDIDTDRRTYYLLAYVPRNTTFAGEWRKIEVKVRRRGVQVRSRGGYQAVPARPRGPADGQDPSGVPGISEPEE